MDDASPASRIQSRKRGLPVLEASETPVDVSTALECLQGTPCAGRDPQIRAGGLVRRSYLAVPTTPIDERAKMLLDAPGAAAIGQPAYVTSTFAEIMGTPPRTFLEWATDHAAEFRA